MALFQNVAAAAVWGCLRPDMESWRLLRYVAVPFTLLGFAVISWLGPVGMRVPLFFGFLFVCLFLFSLSWRCDVQFGENFIA